MFFLTPNIRPISHTKSLNAQFRGLKSFFFFLFFLHTLKQFQQQQWTYCETLANPTDDNPLITTPDSIFISPHLPQTNEDEEETKIISSFDKPETNTGLLKELKPHAKLLRPFKNKTNEDLFSKKIEDKRVNLSKVKEQTSLINRSPINKEKQDHSKEEEPTTFITSLSINKEREDVLKKEEQTNIITPLSINNEGTDLSNKEEQTDIITPSSINKEGANPSNNEEQTDIITPLSINKEGADLSNKEEQTNLTTLLPVNKEGTDFASKKEETNLITSLPVNKEGTDLANKGEQTSLITPLPINQEKRNSLVPFVTPKTTFKEYLYTNMFSTFILLTWITFIYILQLYIDRNFNLSFYRSNHACSCLLAGGNLRGLGETSLVTFARMIACCFIHISFPHYLTTLITLVGSCCFAFTLFPIYNWIPYWVVPLYLICGLAKSIMTWKKKLYSVGTSSSASGSCFGIAAFIWILHSLTDSSKPSTLYNFIFWGCILCSGFMYLQDDVDIKALFISIVIGGLCSLFFSAYSKPNNLSMLIITGKWLTYFCYALCLLVYCEIFREALLDKRELLIRSYVKAYVLQETSEEKRLIPNRGQELTQKLLNILHEEKVPQTSEAILDRLLKYSQPSTTFLSKLGGQVA